MSTLEIKQELHDLIEHGDDRFIKVFYELAKSYVKQLKDDKMIAESEDDIVKGRIHSQDEVLKIIENWKEK